MTIAGDRIGTGSELAGGLEHGSSASAELQHGPADAGRIGRAEEDRLDWIENQARCRSTRARTGHWGLAALSLVSAAGFACIAGVVALLT